MEQGPLDEKSTFWQIISSLNIPDVVRKNTIYAIFKGIGSIIRTGLEIPEKYLASKVDLIEANTKAKILVIEKSSASAASLFADDPELSYRALNYFGSKIIQSQINRERIAHKSLQEIQGSKFDDSNKKTVSDEWLTHFWSYAENQSMDDIQNIFAKLLAMEIQSPSTVSPATISCLAQMTPDTAKKFENLANLSFDDGEWVFVVHLNVFPFQNIGPMDDYGVAYNDLFDLEGVNLIRSAETLKINFAESTDYSDIKFAHRTGKVKIGGKQLNLIFFTQAGRDLRRIITLNGHEKYMSAIQEEFGTDLILD